VKKESKILDWSLIFSVIREIRNKKIVLVGGCFDIFHYGHFYFLKKSRSFGDFLIVALESDKFIVKNKKRKPIHNQQQRAEILSGFYFVDLIILLPYFSKEDYYFDLVKKIKPKIIAVTKNDPKIKNKKEQATLISAEIKKVTPFIKNFSSTRIYRMYEAFFSD